VDFGPVPDPTRMTSTRTRPIPAGTGRVRVYPRVRVDPHTSIADDTQLLVAMNVTDAGPALERLANCSTAVRRWWFLRNDLQLNADKSEVVILGTAPQLRSAADIREVEVAGSGLQVAPKLKSLGVTIDSHLRFDCHAKEVARACNYIPYTRPASRAYCANRRLGSDSSVQYRRFQVGLLKRHALRCTSCDFRCTAASAEQPSQGRLPAGRSNRRQTTSQIAPLAASQASSDIQDGGADVQDNVLLKASVLE